MGKEQVITGLRKVLRESFDAKYSGADIRRHALVQGQADGYMRALIDLAVAEETELLTIVNEERRQAAERADLTAMHASQAQAFA